MTRSCTTESSVFIIYAWLFVDVFLSLYCLFVMLHRPLKSFSVIPECSYCECVSRARAKKLHVMIFACNMFACRGGRRRKTIKLSRDLSDLVVFTNSVVSQECLDEGKTHFLFFLFLWR